MKALSLAAALIALVTMSCRSIPDSVMLQNFLQHRATLDQLAAMAAQDHLSCPIPASGEAACISAPRRAEYQTLLKSAHVFGISPQWNRGCVLFPSVQESALLAMHSHARGYAYSTGSPLLPDTHDTAEEVGEHSMAFKPVNGHWYLYFSA